MAFGKPGDPDGTGTVSLSYIDKDKKTATISFQLATNNVALPLEGADIHKAPPGSTGRAVVRLFTFSADSDISGTVDMSKCQAKEIFNHPEDYYVDVHNAEFPDGAVRGQLTN